jgi:hypothetical protein
VFYKGEGCAECNLTGYRGRLTVAELWVPSELDITLIAKSAPFEDIRASARSSTSSMAESAWQLIKEGQTNLEELIRMLPYQATVDFRHRRFGLQDPPPVRHAKGAAVREALPALQ